MLPSNGSSTAATSTARQQQQLFQRQKLCTKPWLTSLAALHFAGLASFASLCGNICWPKSSSTPTPTPMAVLKGDSHPTHPSPRHVFQLSALLFKRHGPTQNRHNFYICLMMEQIFGSCLQLESLTKRINGHLM